MLKTLLINSSSNAGLFLLKLVVAFVLTPVIVHALGNHDYGINEIVLALIGYMGLLEIGLQPAVTRFTAHHLASGSMEARHKVFNSSVLFGALIGISVAAGLCIWAFLGASGLPPSESNNSRYVIFLLIIAFQVLISFPGNVFLCIHHGHQRYGLTNLIAAVNTIIGSIVVYYFLKYEGYGLVFLTAANALGVSIKFVVLGFLLRFKKYGAYRLRRRYLDLSTLRELLFFGGKSFLLGISSSFSKRASPILIGTLINPSMVAFYILPYNLIGYISNLVSAVTLNFMPYFSDLNASKNLKTTQDVFVTSSRIVAGLAAFCFLTAAFFGRPFLSEWVGQEYADKGGSVLYIASVWAFLRGINPFHGRILTGMGLHGTLANIRFFEAFVYLLAAIPLAMYLGVEGVALGILIASILTEPIVLWFVCKQIKITISYYITKVVLPFLLPLLIVCFFYLYVFTSYNVSGYFEIIVPASLGGLAYCLMYLLVGISKSERIEILKRFRKLSFAKSPK